jgi:hypothetical protein
MNEDTNIYTCKAPIPKYVGMYMIGGDQGLCFSFEQKPKWFHRKMMQYCLGWEWKDTV